jgi:Fibronectin type III domain
VCSGFTTPTGTSPQISSYLRRSAGSITSTNDSCPDSGLVSGYRTDWTSGTAEPGSSGSGLWNLNGYLVGVLSCGPFPPTCNNPDGTYSKFANFYPQIRPYIGPQTPSPPIATRATFVASHSFRANWRSVSGATGYRLDVATNNSFTNYVTGYQNLNVGNALSRIVTALNASTPYYYRLRAYNGFGTSGNSNVINVTTLSPTGPPVAITNPATNVTNSSATLRGWVYPHGLSTTVYFQYGRTTSYGSRTPNQIRTANTYQGVIANISGLVPNTTYHFRIVASNIAGTRYGTDRTFTTP